MSNKTLSKSARKAKAQSGEKVVATNRRALHDYEVIDKFEAGIVLLGPEVKSLRDAKVNLGDAYAYIGRGEAWIEKMHISPYEPATRANPSNPQRKRKLLLHRREIDRLTGKVRERGLTLVPLRVYFSPEGRAKVELALVRGKHQYDKRETLKRRVQDLEARRAMRQRGRS